MAFIEITRLNKRFDKVVALRDVDLSIGKGEIMSVVGLSGGGKTTLLKCVAGLEVPDSGRIVVGDNVVFDSERGINVPPERRGMGFVPQTWGLWPHMKVRDNIAFGLKIRKVSKDEVMRRVKYVSEVLGIDHLLDRWPWQLSGGQQQRVALARALVLEPNVLLLDEPLSNLDAAVREETRVWLRNMIKRFKITAMYVTHDMHEAMVMGDKVAFIAEGVIRKVGTPEEIYRNMDDIYVARLFGFNVMRVEVVANGGSRTMIRLRGGDVKFWCRNSVNGPEAYIIVNPSDVVIGEGPIRGRIVSMAYVGDYYEYIISIDEQRIKARHKIPVPSGEVMLGFRDCITVPSAQPVNG